MTARRAHRRLPQLPLITGLVPVSDAVPVGTRRVDYAGHLWVRQPDSTWLSPLTGHVSSAPKWTPPEG